MGLHIKKVEVSVLCVTVTLTVVVATEAYFLAWTTAPGSSS